jgi:thioredoxin-like negative regulator of GroEL
MKVEGRRQRWAAIAVVVVMAATFAWCGQPAQPPASDSAPAVTPPEPRLTSQTTLSAGVVQLMVSGNAALARGSRVELQGARQAFEHAILRDERYAPAHAGLAAALVGLATAGWDHPDQVLPLAVTHADRAIELDPTLALAWQTLARAEVQFKRDWPRAEMHYRRATALAPDSDAAALLAQLLLATGRRDDALTESVAALKSNPASADRQASTGVVHRFAGRMQDALPYFERALSLNPRHAAAAQWRAVTLADLGRLDEALAALPQEDQGTAGTPRWVQGYVQALSGNRRAAGEVFNELSTQAGREYVPAIQFAYLSCALGQREQALEWIEASVGQHNPWIEMIAVDPVFRSLHGEPRFRTAVTAMQLGAAR